MSNHHYYLMLSSRLRQRLLDLAADGNPPGIQEFMLLIQMDGAVLNGDVQT